MARADRFIDARALFQLPKDAPVFCALCELESLERNVVVKPTQPPTAVSVCDMCAEALAEEQARATAVLAGDQPPPGGRQPRLRPSW